LAKEDILKEFEGLKGVGRAKAEALYDHGFTSMDKLKTASLSDLTAVNGVTEKLAKDIHSQIQPKKTEEKPAPQKKKEEKTPPAKEEKPAPKKKAVEEPDEYQVKMKPDLSKQMKKRLAQRSRINKRRPDFLREEWFRYKKIPKNWRRPDGITSKMRINKKYRPSKVRVGFRSPRDVRGLHPSGFEEVLIHTLKEIEGVDPKTQAVRIGSTVGTKKRVEIEKKADERKIRILNRGQ
jgi:large subunit ribosomal protein L32e